MFRTPSPRLPPAAALQSVVLAVILAGGCAGPEDPAPLGVGHARQKINDGILEPGEPSVLLLYHNYYGVMCTGTLIGKRLVLTAKHCVQDDNGQMLGASGWRVNVGPNMYAISNSYTVSEVRATPGANIENSDIGLMLLSRDADETPYRLKFTLEQTGFIGSGALLIGYGQDGCPSGDAGTKYRTVDEVIGWATSNDFITDGQGANHGDSGGPVFDPDTMEVIGVISRGGDCTEYPGITVAVRVDAWRDFINQALTDTGDCAPTSLEEICNDGLDNNCDGVVDEGCAPEGTSCTVDEDCASRFCRDVGTGGLICTTPCDIRYGGAECSPSAYCQYLSCGEGACTPGAAGSLAVGEPCQADTDCQDLLCADPGTGIPVCLAYCTPGTGQCLGTEACAPLDPEAGCGGCLPDADLPGPFRLGERCDTAQDCLSGLCVDDEGFSYCTTECVITADCPAAFHCRDGNCLHGDPGGVGEPCVDHEDCAGGLSCLGASPTQPGYCTTSCSQGESCAEGTTCDGVACVLDGLPLGDGCTAASDCATRGCFSFGGRNACTLLCDRHTPCPPLMACVEADNGMTLCQPHRLPMVDIEDPPTKPKKDCATGGPSGLPLLTLAMALLWLRRRRRR